MLHIFLRVNSLVAMLSIEHLFSFSSFCQLAHLRYSWFSLVHRICWKVQRRLKIAHQLIVSIHMLNPTFIHFNHCISLLSKSHKNRVCIFNCVYMCIYIYIYIHFSFYNKYILSCTGYTYNLPVFFSYPQTFINPGTTAWHLCHQYCCLWFEGSQLCGGHRFQMMATGQ